MIFYSKVVLTEYQEKKRLANLLGFFSSLLISISYLFMIRTRENLFSIEREWKNAHYHTNGGSEIEEQEELWNRLRK